MELVIAEARLNATDMSELSDALPVCSASSVSGSQHASRARLFRMYLLIQLTTMPAAMGTEVSVSWGGRSSSRISKGIF